MTQQQKEKEVSLVDCQRITIADMALKKFKDMKTIEVHGYNGRNLEVTIGLSNKKQAKCRLVLQELGNEAGYVSKKK